MERTSVKEALFIVGVVLVGAGIQLALGLDGSNTVLRPIALALLALLLLGAIRWARAAWRARGRGAAERR